MSLQWWFVHNFFLALAVMFNPHTWKLHPEVPGKSPAPSWHWVMVWLAWFKSFTLSKGRVLFWWCFSGLENLTSHSVCLPWFGWLCCVVLYVPWPLMLSQAMDLMILTLKLMLQHSAGAAFCSPHWSTNLFHLLVNWTCYFQTLSLGQRKAIDSKPVF